MHHDADHSLQTGEFRDVAGRLNPDAQHLEAVVLHTIIINDHAASSIRREPGSMPVLSQSMIVHVCILHD